MRAMAIEEFGGPEKLRQMALPRPKPVKGEVLIRVVAAGVNPIDAAIRSGWMKDRLPYRFPLVPGWDVAGVVEELGEGATRFRRGERVWGCARKPTAQWGCYAEYVALPESAAALIPAKLLFEEAAAVPLAGLAAYQTLFGKPGVGPDKVVLVHAAAGGVGHFAVQLARLAGARVFGTGSTSNQPFILSLGAEAGIDYSKEDFAAALRRHAPDGADVILDTVGGETLQRSYELLKPGGRLVSLLEEPDRDAARERSAEAHFHMVQPDGDQLRILAQKFDRKQMSMQVYKIYSLAEAAEAQRTVETGHVQGKLVLNL